jgi:hypothetical protein
MANKLLESEIAVKWVAGQFEFSDTLCFVNGQWREGESVCARSAVPCALERTVIGQQDTPVYHASIFPLHAIVHPHRNFQ